MANTVGTAYVQIIPSAEGISNSISKAIGAEAQKAGTDAGKSMSTKIGDALGGAGKVMTKAGKSMTKSLTVPIAAGFAGAIKTTADFDASMSNVLAISGATSEEFETLRAKAREMGASTKFSASEAADAMSYMAMAGWKADQMTAGLPGILSLAAASGEDLATTSDIVTDALTAFGLTAEDSSHFSDVLAAASSNANTNVSMLGESFKYVAPVAGALGYSAEDTSLALGLMANSGIKASQAGTTLRQLLNNMVSPTDDMAAAMDDLGISLYDDEGKMYSFKDIMDQMRTGFGDLMLSNEEFTDALAELDAQLEAGEISESAYEETLGDLISKTFGAEEAQKAKTAADLAGARGMSGLLAIVNASEEDYNKLSSAIEHASVDMQSITEAVTDSGVEWDKYADKAWMAGDGLSGMLDEVVYNMTELGTSAEEMAEYLQFEYDLDAGDALAVIDSVSESLENGQGAAARMAETMQDNLSGRVTVLKSAIEELAISFGDLLMPSIEKVVGWVQSFVNKMNSLDDGTREMIIKIGAVVAVLGPALLVGGKIATAVSGIITKLPVIKAGLTAIKGAFAAVSAPVLIVVAAIGALVAVFVHLWNTNEGFRNAIIGTWETIKETVGGFIDGIVQRFNDLGINFDSITAALKTAWEGLCNFFAPIFEGAFSYISIVVQTVLGEVTGIVDIFIGVFTGNWEQVWNGVKTFFTSIWNGIKGVVTTVLNTINQITNGKLTAIKNKFVSIFDGIKDKVTNVVNTIKGIFNFTWSLPHISLPHFSISPPGWSIGDLLKGSIPSLGISWYAKGGMFDSPSVVGIGEAGPEAVVPLDPFWDRMDTLIEKVDGSQRPIVINVYPSAGQDEESIAKAVERRLIMNLQRKELVYA